MVNQDDPIVRKSVSLPSSLWKQVDDYQFANRLKREAEAIRRLIEIGLKAQPSAAAGSDASG